LVTKFAKDVVYRVTFTDGTSVRANADHEFLCRDGVKRKVKDLKVGSPLMPFFTANRQMKGQRLHAGYERVYLPGPMKYAYTHRVVGRFLNGGVDPVTWDGDRAVLHHVDFNCKNNSPGNFRWMGWAAHRALHASVPRSDAWRARMSAMGHQRATDPSSPLRVGHLRYMRSARGRALSVSNLSKWEAPPGVLKQRAAHGSAVRGADPKQRALASKRCRARSAGNTWGSRSSRVRRDVTVDGLYEAFDGVRHLGEVYARLRVSRNAVVRILATEGLTLSDLKRGYRNHKVASIVEDGFEHVYCLTVPAWGNFAVVTDAEKRRGVFSGNTGAIGTGKSTIACAGMAYKAYLLSCLRDPSRYYGLLSDSLIVFGIYSITKRQVNDTGYHKLKAFIDASPYFLRDFPRQMNLDSKIMFTRSKLQVIPGCVARGTLVATPWGAVPIEELGQKPVVLSLVEGAVVAVPCSVVKSPVRAPCLAISTTSGAAVVVSCRHKVAVVRGASCVFIPAEDLVVGDLVQGLRKVAASERVLREQPAFVQNVYSEENQRAVSSDQDVPGPEARASVGPDEAVPEVPDGEAPRGVPRTGVPYGQWSDTDAVAFLVQALRVPGVSDLLPPEHGADTGEGESVQFDADAAKSDEDTLESVLRGETLRDSGEVVIARRAFTSAAAAKSSQSERPGEGCRARRTEPCDEPEVVSREPREGAGLRSPLCADSVGPEDSSLGGTAAGGTEACVTGYAYAIGHRLSTGVLWRKVLFLWGKPVDPRVYSGPFATVDTGRWYSAGEYRARMSELQFVQEQSDVGGVLRDAATPSPRGEDRQSGGAEDPEVHVERIVSLRPLGERETFDLVDVGPSHSYFADGVLVSNSQSLHSIGLDLFSFLLDEVNFMKAKFDTETQQMSGQAYELYNSTHARLMSRFMRPGGFLPGMMFLVSSRGSKTAFLEERIKQSSGRESTYVSDYPLWEVKPKSRYIMPWFNVEVGDKLASSRLLAAGVQQRPGSFVVSIPGEFRRSFEEDIDRALRDLAGVATYNLSPLIRDRESVMEAVKPWLTNPITKLHVTANLNDQVQLSDYFDMKAACRVENSKWVPKLNPGSPRCIHIDQSLRRDFAGFAMSHLGGTRKTNRYDPLDGLTHTINAPVVFTDLMLQIIPPTGSEIDLSKIREFVVFLSRVYNIVMITFDGFQSADSRQLLEKAGYPAGMLSVDRTDNPYMTLRNALFERRLYYPDFAPVRDELLDLQHDSDRGKVDHPQIASNGGPGRKDVADALCGSVFTALTHEDCKHYASSVIIPEDYETNIVRDIPAVGSVVPDARGDVHLSDPAPVNRVRQVWGDLSKNVRQ
jgi:hypothetical protein